MKESNNVKLMDKLFNFVIFSFGQQPYDGKTSVETVQYIEAGHRYVQFK